jgi:elongation factor G
VDIVDASTTRRYVFPADRIRNVALVGHHGSGKTTLTEALLYRAGAVDRLGSVEAGTTVSDFEPEEHGHGMSVSLSLCSFEWRDHRVNIIDTPGYPDFAGEVSAALRVADMAVFVVDAVNGVEVETEKQWRLAEKLNIPRMIFINKLDKEHASFDKTLDALQDRFGAGIAPIELPLGSGPSFHGVVDLFEDEAHVYDSGHSEPGEIPEEMKEQIAQVEEALIEGIVVADDDLLEQYLGGDVPPVDTLEHVMADGVAEASVFPVVCGSATGPIAVDRLADYIVELGTPPTARPSVPVIVGDETMEIDSDPEGDPLVFVFKTVADPYVGQISMFRVLSGTIRPDMTLYNGRSSSTERLAKVGVLQGKESVVVDALTAGALGATSKLSDTATGDVLTPRNMPVQVPPIDIPAPVIGLAIKAKALADDDRLATGLRRLQEEDRSVIVEHDDETGQTVMRGLGETHLNVSIEKLCRKMGIEVETEPERVRFRETVTRSADAEGKHKKQSGGHGQFGVAMIKVQPLPRGAGFEFFDEIKGGSIPRQFIPAVEQGVVRAMTEGGVQGFPVTDVAVHLYDGKYHSVDSSELSFQMAGRLAFLEAFQAAGPTVLEPVSKVEVTVPPDFQGDVLGDLASRRGQVQGSMMDEFGNQVITALVPTAEILTYATDLRSISRGWGSVKLAHDHYEELPASLAARVLAAHAPKTENGD